MCLYINKSLHKEIDNILQPHIAKSNMTVWKVITTDNYSYYKNKPYKPNTLYPRVKFGYYSQVIKQILETVIEMGYHSYKSRENARNLHFNSIMDDTKIVKFIIPKGAKYYIGEDGDIVSNIIKSGDLKHCR